ncbi:MAG: transporter [Candidatus Melainabacteria bacterium]|nr:transporter [Candidatus Melainabacteria bacterium]
MKTNYIISLLLCFFVSLLLVLPSYAHHGGEGGLGGGAGIAGPIVTIPAYALPKGSKFISLITNYTNADESSNTRLSRLGLRGEDYDVVENTLSPSLTAGLGITNRFSLSLQLPYIFRYGIRRVEAIPQVVSQGNSIGVGDINLFGLYEFLHSEKYDFHAALLAGLKIPSGVVQDKTRQGNLFKAEHQAGTGSFDPQVGLALSKHLGIFHLDSNFMYRFSTKGVQNTILGDVISYNFAISYLIGTHKKDFLKKIFVDHILGKKANWHLIAETNGNWVEKPNVRGVREENEGGTLVYLSPGIRLILDKKWIANLSIGLPTIENLNGRRRPPNIRLIFGLTRVF